jgi:phospholipid/cholesterol/gamma-HCH transport system substrate-binding protein
MPSAARVRWAKFRVSAVSLVAILILLVLFYLLTGGTLLSQKVPLYLYMPDGLGLEPDSPVRVDGVDVGKVKTVRLSGSHDPQREVVATLSVQSERLSSIPTASEAEISSDSLIGDKFVDVTSHPAAATVAPEGEIHLKPPNDLMKAIDIRDLEKQLVQVDTMLRDLEEGRGPVGEFVQGRQMYIDVVKRFAEIETAFRAAVAATTDVGRALYKDELYRTFFDTVMKVDAELAQLQAGEGPAGQFLRNPAQYDQWRKTVASMRQSVATIQASPWIQSDATYTAWNRSLSSLIAQVDEMNAHPEFATSATYDRLTGMAQDLRESVRDFRLHPGKYLRLKVF